MSTIDAVAYLATVKDHIRAARISTAKAGISLAGARKARCDELAELLADAQNHADRLAFAVEADLQSELHAGNNAT